MLEFCLGQVNIVVWILMAPSASWRDSGENEDVFVRGMFFSDMISGVNLNGGNLVLLVSSQGATCSRAAA